MEVLYGHAPLMAELGAGDVIVQAGAGRKMPGGADGVLRYNVSWGFVEVLPDRVTILATDALKPEEIDVRAPSSNSTAATSSGTRPAKAKRPTPKLCASSPKPKPRSPRRRKSTDGLLHSFTDSTRTALLT